MNKLLLFSLVILLAATASAQKNVLILKKKNHSIQYFREGSYISFQLHNKEWIKGVITHIANDSFALKLEEIRNNFFGPPDTFHYSGYKYAVSDVYAFPKKGVQIEKIDGRYQVDMGGGHQHFYWVKSGWLFRAGALGYAGLYVVNSVIENDFSGSGSALAITAGAFAVGVLLKHTYKLTHKIGHRFTFQMAAL